MHPCFERALAPLRPLIPREWQWLAWWPFSCGAAGKSKPDLRTAEYGL